MTSITPDVEEVLWLATAWATQSHHAVVDVLHVLRSSLELPGGVACVQALGMDADALRAQLDDALDRLSTVGGRALEPSSLKRTAALQSAVHDAVLDAEKAFGLRAGGAPAAPLVTMNDLMSAMLRYAPIVAPPGRPGGNDPR